MRFSPGSSASCLLTRLSSYFIVVVFAPQCLPWYFGWYLVSRRCYPWRLGRRWSRTWGLLICSGYCSSPLNVWRCSWLWEVVAPASSRSFLCTTSSASNWLPYPPSYLLSLLLLPRCFLRNGTQPLHLVEGTRYMVAISVLFFRFCPWLESSYHLKRKRASMSGTYQRKSYRPPLPRQTFPSESAGSPLLRKTSLLGYRGLPGVSAKRSAICGLFALKSCLICLFFVTSALNVHFRRGGQLFGLWEGFGWSEFV